MKSNAPNENANVLDMGQNEKLPGGIKKRPELD
jgi:hypothetical protein